MNILTQFYKILLILIILKSSCLTAINQIGSSDFNFKLSNAISPVSYFLTNSKNLEEITKNLNLYKKISLCDFSGTGKTQLLRKYVEIKKNDYDIIWFFDANLDLHSELLKLSREINLKEGSIVVSEDTRTVVSDIKKYFSHKKRWLFIFDNLKVGCNLKLKPILKWEHNGHIIISSEDANLLPNIINIERFSRDSAIALAKKFLKMDKREFENFLANRFSDHPGIIVLAAQIINNYPGLTLKEYQKLINSRLDYIKLNLDLAKRNLDQSAQELLYKIALINNNYFSKDFVKIIHKNKNIAEPMLELQKLMIITNINAKIDYFNIENDPNPIYEMGDIITYTLKGTKSEYANKKALNQIIDNIIEYSTALERKEVLMFLSAQTTIENIKIILTNAKKYNINLYKIVFLKICLFEIYMYMQDYHSASQLKDWFIENNIEEYFAKDFWKTNFKKFIISEYLLLIGTHSYFSLCDIKNSLKYLTKSLRIKDSLNSEYKYISSKSINLAYFVILYSRVEQFQEAQKFLNILKTVLKKIPESKKDKYMLYFAKSYLLFYQKDYENALQELEYCTKSMSQIFPSSEHGMLKTESTILKARTLNALTRYQEGLNLLKALEKFYQNKAHDHITLGVIYIYMAESYFGLDNQEAAESHLDLAKKILSSDRKRNIGQFLDPSKATDLDLSYIYQMQSKIAIYKQEQEKAENLDLIAVQIYQNTIQGIMQDKAKER